MTSKYQPGDTVRCVDPGATPFVRHWTYTVTATDNDLLKVSGSDLWWSASRFVFWIDNSAASAPTPGQSAQLPKAPDDNPKTRFGMAKPPLGLIPGAAQVLVATAFADGAVKYGPANWRVDPVSASTYVNAALRHLHSWYDGEESAADSGVHHLAHAAACLMILLDAQAASTLNDDRPPATGTADLIKRLTKPMG